jgi:hypothetical protein
VASGDFPPFRSDSRGAGRICRRVSQNGGSLARGFGAVPGDARRRATRATRPNAVARASPQLRRPPPRPPCCHCSRRLHNYHQFLITAPSNRPSHPPDFAKIFTGLLPLQNRNPKCVRTPLSCTGKVSSTSRAPRSRKPVEASRHPGNCNSNIRDLDCEMPGISAGRRRSLSPVEILNLTMKMS